MVMTYELSPKKSPISWWHEHERMVATLKAEYEASIAALRRELRSAEQDFDDGLKAILKAVP